MSNHRGYKKSAKERNVVLLDGDRPRIVRKKYHVTAQTAYHITDLALREGISEGRVIDKIMRTYLATQREYHK